MTARHLAVYANGHTPDRLELRSWDGTIIRTIHTANPRRLHHHAATTARRQRAARPRPPRGIHPTTLTRWVRRTLGVELAPWQAATLARAARPLTPPTTIGLITDAHTDDHGIRLTARLTLPPIHDKSAIVRIHPGA